MTESFLSVSISNFGYLGYGYERTWVLVYVMLPEDQSGMTDCCFLVNFHVFQFYLVPLDKGSLDH